MKTWNAPLAAVQQFTATDYVSACSNTILCDVDMVGDFKKYYVDFGGKTYTAGWGDNQTLTFGNLGRCGKVKEIGKGEAFEVTITKGWTKYYNEYKEEDLVDLPKEQQFKCIIWHEYDENGYLTDGHGSMSWEGLDINKS